MELQEVLSYLNALSENNNKKWFTDNKNRYEEAKSAFLLFTELLINKIKEFDSRIGGLEAKNCMFRIYRDVRFSKNKMPYKTNFASFISQGGRKSHFAGYYIHMEVGKSFVGGGIYMPPADNLKKIRKRIYDNPKQLIEILNEKEFKKYFDGIYGEKLKSAPRGYPKDWEHIDLINHKHYALAFTLKDDFWGQNDLLEKILSIFRVQYTFNEYLNQIIE